MQCQTKKVYYMEKYHFYKIAEVRNKNNSCWYFKPLDKKQLQEHWEKYSSVLINESISDILERQLKKLREEYVGHPTNEWTSFVEQITEIKGGNVLGNSNRMEFTLLKNREEMMNNKEEFFLDDKLTTFMLTPGITEIIDEFVSNMLEYPDEKMSIDNVRYIQWDGGKHWYAKIGKLDIVDEDGNQKWNSKQEAENAVRKYFFNLTNK